MSDLKLTSISGIGPATARVLTENGFGSVATLAQTTPEELARVPGFGAARAAAAIQAAQSLLSVGGTQSADAGASRKTADAGKEKKKKKRDKKSRGKDKKKKKKKDKKGKGKGKDKKDKKKKKK